MEQLDYSQIADAVNRSGFGNDNKSRRELMRLGESDPTAFYNKYKDFIIEPTQPVESDPYVQANQAQQPEPTWSLFDYMNPGEGYRTEDIGRGQYNIYDSTNNNLGVGYKSLLDSIKELQADYVKNYIPPEPPTSSEYSDYGYALFEQNRFNPAHMPTEYIPGFNQGGALSEWEVLGNLLSGGPIDTSYGTTSNNKRAFPGDGKDNLIQGLNTLYGSTPIFSNNKLLGYKMDLTPATINDPGYVNPNLVRKQDTSGSTRSDAFLGREYQNMDTWNNLLQDMGEGNYFLGADNAANAPGWLNKDGYQYAHKSNNLFGTLAPIALSFVPGMQPLAAAFAGLNSLATTGTGFGALSAGLGLSGVFNGLGNALGVSQAVGNRLGSTGLNSIFDQVQGKPFNLKNTLLNTALSESIGGLGNMFKQGAE